MKTTEQVLKKLSGLVPPEFLTHFPDLPDKITASILYGSCARGDYTQDSDVDILCISDHTQQSINTDRISVSFYTLPQILTGVGSLFGYHLRRDGIILTDPTGTLQDALENFSTFDFPLLQRKIFSLSQIFTTPEYDLPKFLPGLLREARYFLRSYLYGKSIYEGRPCFSLNELAKRHHNENLATLLSSHRRPPSYDEYDTCLDFLEAHIGRFPPSKHGSLEATVVNEWGTDSDLYTVAYLALGVTGQCGDYEEVRKILL